jgi:hypothetical protein
VPVVQVKSIGEDLLMPPGRGPAFPAGQFPHAANGVMGCLVRAGRGRGGAW